MKLHRHICPVCGAPFFGKIGRVYCSINCCNESKIKKDETETRILNRAKLAKEARAARLAARLAARDAEYEAWARENGVAPIIEERDGKVVEIRGQKLIASRA